MLCSFLRPTAVTATLASPCPTLSLCRVCTDLHGSAGRTQLGRQSIWRRFHLGAKPLSWIMLNHAEYRSSFLLQSVSSCYTLHHGSIMAEPPCARSRQTAESVWSHPCLQHRTSGKTAHMFFARMLPYDCTASTWINWVAMPIMKQSTDLHLVRHSDMFPCVHLRHIWDIWDHLDHLRLEKMDEWMNGWNLWSCQASPKLVWKLVRRRKRETYKIFYGPSLISFTFL